MLQSQKQDDLVEVLEGARSPFTLITNVTASAWQLLKARQDPILENSLCRILPETAGVEHIRQKGKRLAQPLAMFAGTSSGNPLKIP